MHTIDKGFAFVGDAEVAAEVENCVVILQWEGAEEFFQFLESLADLRWVTFVGFSIGLVELIQNSLAVTIPGVKMQSVIILQIKQANSRATAVFATLVRLLLERIIL